MSYTFSTYLIVKNRDDFRRVLEFAQPDRLETNPEKLELFWTGETCCEKAKSVVAQFPDIEFRICDSWDFRCEIRFVGERKDKMAGTE